MTAAVESGVAMLCHAVGDEIATVDVRLMGLQYRLGELGLGLDAACGVIPERGHDATLLPVDGGRIDIENARKGDPAQLQSTATRFEVVGAEWDGGFPL
jgi:hypothetical protein